MKLMARCAFCLIVVEMRGATLTTCEGPPCPARGLINEPLPCVPQSRGDRMTAANAEGARKRSTFGHRKRK